MAALEQAHGIGAREDGNNVRMRNFASRASLAPPRNRGASQSGLTLGARPSRLSKYGVSFQPPDDDAVHYHDDARQMRFFEKVIGGFLCGLVQSALTLTKMCLCLL